MKNVLVLGSGFTAKPLVDYLHKQHDYHITVTGLTAAEAQNITHNRPRTSALALNIMDDEALQKLIAAHDFVASMLPYEFHTRVARFCVAQRTSMLTTSYAKEEIYTLDRPARDNGVLILKEVGLDPGFDHISAMQIIHNVKAQGGKISSFKSYAGGFPAPEADTNPWHYKFSWSPKGVLIAARSDAKYLHDQQIIDMPGKDILEHTWRLVIDGVEYEAYPNRDALPYLQRYQIEGAETIMRATLRYPGWAEMMSVVNRLGLLSDVKISGVSGLTHRQLFERMTHFDGQLRRQLHAAGATGDIYDKLAWLGLFDEHQIVHSDNSLTPIDYLVKLMVAKMQYAKGERDMVLLYHDFLADYPDRREKISARLIEYGDPHGYTAMSKTVGLPAAVAAHLYLQGKIDLTGVQIPVVPALFEPIMRELLALGFGYSEQCEVLPPVEG